VISFLLMDTQLKEDQTQELLQMKKKMDIMVCGKNTKKMELLR